LIGTVIAKANGRSILKPNIPTIFILDNNMTKSIDSGLLPNFLMVASQSPGYGKNGPSFRFLDKY